MYGILVWMMFPQERPHWRIDPETGEPELYETMEEAAARKLELLRCEDLRYFAFAAARYPDGLRKFG